MQIQQKELFGLLLLLIFFLKGGFAESNNLTAGTNQSYKDLVELYNSFREFHLPEVENGVPDYSHEAMEAKFEELLEYQNRLATIDTTGWELHKQVDYRIVEAEMKGMEFEHRVTQPWKKDPAFYAVVNFQFGPKMHRSMSIPNLPVQDENLDEVKTQLEAIPEILDQAKQNLTESYADLAYIAIYTSKRQMNIMEDFIEGLEPHHPNLVSYAEDAFNAIHNYREWLVESKPDMENGAGVGIDNYNWYLENVALMPYTWEELMILSKREYERAITTMKLKEHKNRHTPVLKQVEKEEDYIQRYNNAMDHLYRFMEYAEVFTMPDYLDAPSSATGFSRGEERDYFQHVLDRYPLPLTIHGYAGHDLDMMRTRRDDRPIRGQPRLYFVDAVRAEAVAAGLEKIYHHIGVVDDVPGAEELTYNLKAFRASRSISELKMHANKISFEEAFQFNIEHTPYGWVPEDSPTIWHDLELYLRSPLYGVSYLAGPVQMDKLKTKAFLQKEEEFDLKEFMDEFLEAGMTPLSLISLEMLGKTQNGHIREIDDKAQLHKLMDEAELFRIKEDPFRADEDGKYREKDRLRSESQEDIERRNAFRKELHSKLLETVDRENLDPNNQISYDLFKRDLEHRIERYEFGTHLFFGRFYNNLVDLHERAPMETTEDYRNYIKRLESIPRYFDQYMERFSKGLETGFTTPKVLFEEEYTNQGIMRQIVEMAEESDFYEPFKKFPSSISENERKKLKEEGREVIMNSVVPAYRELMDFMENEYIPNARESIGVSDLPGGSEYYDHLVKYHTTLPMTAEEVYEKGLEEVERIRGEMLEIIDDLGFEGSFEEFLEFLRTDEQFYVDEPEELLKEASYLAKKIDGKLPELFHLSSLPRRPYGVEPVPDHLAPRYTGGRYSVGGGKRGGYFWVNTYDLSSRPLYTLEALLYHEAVPGHHLEIALSQELEDAPRRPGGITAYSEGWALYAERLPLEVGLYQDPYNDFGRLTYEMWRACRIVVDPGIHAFGWTRDEVVDFMTKNTALSHHEIDTETDRYIRATGQAISYKIGELKITELREIAEKELGDQFDVRDFHKVVLKRGPVLLPALEEQVEEYIEKEL